MNMRRSFIASAIVVACLMNFAAADIVITDLDPLIGPGNPTYERAPAELGPALVSGDDVAAGITEANASVMFLEQEDYTLPVPLTMSVGGTLPAGTVVTSYLVHFDPQGANSNPIWETYATVQFSRPVLGLIYAINSEYNASTDLLTVSDDIVGVPGVTYDYGTNISKNGRKFEQTGGKWIDYAEIVDDHTVKFHIFTNSSTDDFRIILGPLQVSHYPLCAGQNITVGEVQVWDDGQDLFVKYVITLDDTCLLETHLDVEQYVADIPQTKKGNPIPGKFSMSQKHDCVTEYTYTVPLDSLSEPLYIAAHAVVRLPSPDSGPVFTDTIFAPMDNGVVSFQFPTLVGGELTLENFDGNALPDIKVSRDGVNWEPLVDGVIPGCITYVQLSSTETYSLSGITASYGCTQETAWGDGCEGAAFPGSNWATYFVYPPAQ